MFGFEGTEGEYRCFLKRIRSIKLRNEDQKEKLKVFRKLETFFCDIIEIFEVGSKKITIE